MKLILISGSVLLIALFTGCKKEMILPDPNLSQLFGKWNWVSSAGGWGYETVTPASSGHDDVLEFQNDGNYTQYRNGDKFTKETFELTAKPNSAPGIYFEIKYASYKGLFHKNEYVEYPQMGKINGDTLWLFDEGSDGYNSVYLKK